MHNMHLVAASISTNTYNAITLDGTVVNVRCLRGCHGSGVKEVVGAEHLDGAGGIVNRVGGEDEGEGGTGAVGDDAAESGIYSRGGQVRRRLLDQRRSSDVGLASAVLPWWWHDPHGGCQRKRRGGSSIGAARCCMIRAVGVGGRSGEGAAIAPCPEAWCGEGGGGERCMTRRRRGGAVRERRRGTMERNQRVSRSRACFLKFPRVF